MEAETQSTITTIPVQQALYLREGDDVPLLRARSAGFADEWLPHAEQMVRGFGPRYARLMGPPAVFALPLGARQVAVVRVTEHAGTADAMLAFHFLVMDRSGYERFARDPFAVAQRLPATWDTGGDLPELAWPAAAPPPRTVAEVQRVLKRVKASALQENEDPEAPDFERTAENSESPALLGGAQVLVDGGKLVFARPQADQPLVEGLWTILPHRMRGKLWPASFAFSNELGFDVVVVAHVNDADFEGYTNEEQAIHYPQGSYELALQLAAESGNQRELDAVFQRRNSGEVLRLALWLLVGMVLVVFGSRLFGPGVTEPTEHHRKAAAAAGIIAVGDPWTAAAMLERGHQVWVRE
jgi:hypothetical protein